jgi:uncharacterized protein (DUF302 family)
MSFDQAIERTTDALKGEGFGILTEIDVSATLKKKLDVNSRPYRILGACNPPFAYKALQAEDKIGTMLPCNVIIQELRPGVVEVAAVDPIASMAAVDNPDLRAVATKVQAKLKIVVDSL